MQKRKKRRVTQCQDLVNGESLWVSVSRSLDILYQAQENHQRITETIAGLMEIQNCTLIRESLELVDSQTRRQFEEGFKETEG